MGRDFFEGLIVGIAIGLVILWLIRWKRKA